MKVRSAEKHAEPEKSIYVTPTTEVTPAVRRSPRKRPNSTIPISSNSKRSLIMSTPSPGQVAQAKKSNYATSPSTTSKEINNSWIHSFSIPTRWEPSVEAGLLKERLTAEEKCAMTRQLCTIILSHTSNTSQAERDHVAICLIKKYPFLSGSYGAGHQYWSKKIKERLLNLKRKVSRAEKKKFQEQGVEIPKGKPGRKRKSKQGEQIYTAVPAIPEGETEETIEMVHQELKDLCKSGRGDLNKINQLMDATFPKRRRDILTKNLRVWDLLKQYPPLQEKKGYGLKLELGRILESKCSLRDIRENLLIKLPNLLRVIKQSAHKEIRKIVLLLENHDSIDQTEMDCRCVMASLPHLLGEKVLTDFVPGQMFWKCILDEDDIQCEIDRTTSPRLISTGSIVDIQSLCLASEGMVVCNFKPANAIINAVISLMASYYVFNANYQKGQPKNVFIFLDYLLFESQSVSLPIGVENLILSLKE